MSAEFSTPTYVGIAVCAFLLLLAAWTIVATFGLVRPIFLPSPLAVVTKLVKLAQDGTLGNDVAVSVYRISIGFLIASVMALATAILIGA